MGVIKALCISEKRGTQKFQIDKAEFRVGHGIVGYAHAGNWHRQVSFLGLGEIEEFRSRGAQVELGAFGENVVAEGFTFKELPVGTRLKAGEVWFEITQIGKKCHSHCNIYKQVGDCIMPREGVFAKVLRGGVLKAGDSLEITEEKLPLDAAIITASDKGSKGERQDTSGDKVEEMLKEAGYTIFDRTILPDEQSELEAKMKEYADKGVALVVTTGGTGFSERDVTPEATLAICDRLTPGIPEAMRALSMKITPRAMLSRAQAGIAKRTLIVNLPGSRKAVEECLGFILSSLQHGIEILHGDAGECGRK